MLASNVHSAAGRNMGRTSVTFPSMDGASFRKKRERMATRRSLRDRIRGSHYFRARSAMTTMPFEGALTTSGCRVGSLAISSASLFDLSKS